MGFNARVDIGKGADRARNGTCRDFSACSHKALTTACEFRIGLRKLHAEGDGFRMNTVAAADGRRKFVLHRARLNCGEQGIHVGEQKIGRLRELNRKAGVEHIG